MKYCNTNKLIIQFQNTQCFNRNMLLQNKNDSFHIHLQKEISILKKIPFKISVRYHFTVNKSLIIIVMLTIKIKSHNTTFELQHEAVCILYTADWIIRCCSYSEDLLGITPKAEDALFLCPSSCTPSCTQQRSLLLCPGDVFYNSKQLETI